MKEQAVSFGELDTIHGVVSVPDAWTTERATCCRRPAVVILNSGLLHKVGPYRLTVDLARAACAKGFLALRFDLGGIGDSAVSPSSDPYFVRTVNDVTTAVEFMSRHFGTETFVVGGLCSGADVSFYTASKEERTVGLFNLDGFGFKNPSYYVHYYGQRLLSWKFVTSKLRRTLTEREETPVHEQEVSRRDRIFPTEEEAAYHFRRIVSRKVPMLYVYTAGAASYNFYKNQLRDTFPDIDFGDLLETEMYPFAEHTFPWSGARAHVVKRIQEWLVSRFQ